MMTYQTLDFFFPLFVFAYGALVTIALNLPILDKLPLEKIPYEMIQQLKAHRVLALVCLFIGAVWSLQNLLIGSEPLPF